MTITENATFPTHSEVRFDRLLNAPIERVWEYIVDSDLRATWMGRGVIELKVGGSATIFYDNSQITDEPLPEDDTFEPHLEEGTVLEVEPPRLLSYTWGEWFGQNCVVTYRLTPDGEDRTHLVLTHSRIEGVPLRDVARGWHVHLNLLANRIDGTEPPSLWDEFEAKGTLYAAMDAASASVSSSSRTTAE